MKPILRIPLITLITLLAVLSVTAAQQEENTAEPDNTAGDIPPVLQLLSLVPDKPEFSQMEMIGFSDFRAQAATRQGAADFDSWAAFEATRETEDEGARLLFNSWGMSGFLNGQYLLTAGPDLPETLGFDFFDIDTALTFGQPPTQVSIYQGDFDADQIDAALTNNGYTREELDGFPYWCAEAGCDTGMEINPADRNPANLFGGDFGRRFPVVLLDDAVVASASNANVELVAEVFQDEAASLADAPRYQTAVAAMYDTFSEDNLNDPAQLRQAYFIPTTFLIAPDPAASLIFGASPEELEALQEQFESENTSVIPLYQLAAFTDFGSNQHQYAQVVLVYGLAAHAQTAVEMIPQRIDTLRSVVTMQPFSEIFSSRGAELLDPAIYTDEATGMYAAVFTFQYPLASAEEDDFGMIQQSGILYRTLANFVFQRDTLWLTPLIGLPEPE